jgi:hypothetical protein
MFKYIGTGTVHTYIIEWIMYYYVYASYVCCIMNIINNMVLNMLYYYIHTCARSVQSNLIEINSLN